MLGKIEGMRRRGRQRMRWLDGITYVMGMSLIWLPELVTDRKPGVLQSMGSQRVGHDLATKQQHGIHINILRVRPGKPRVQLIGRIRSLSNQLTWW